MAAENRGRAVRTIDAWLLRPMWVAAGILFAAFATLAYFLFTLNAPDTFLRAVSGAFIEIAFVVLLGAGLTHLLHRLARSRSADEAIRARRQEVIRRLAAADSEVASAQRLLSAGRRHSYRELTRAVSLFEEIQLDLQANADLFPPEAPNHIRQIVGYLTTGVSRRNRPWTTDFIAGRGAFSSGYRTPLRAARTAMRGRVTRP